MHKTTEFDGLVRKLMKESNVPGFSIAVIQGEEIHAKTYGYAKLPDQKCTKDTLFDCASTSKSMTAAAVACLVQDEAYPDVQWKTPVSKLMPEDFVLPDPQLTKEITIEDILSHRTGHPRHDLSYLGIQAKTPDTAQSITRNLRNLPFAKPLRTQFLYSNIMFTVATHLIESVTGKSYPEFIREKLWDPLGMTDTFHDIPEVEARDAMDRKATGYRWDKETKTHIAMPFFRQPEGQGAGCVFSTASDYAKWVQAMIKKSPPLTAAMHKDLTTPRTIITVDEGEEIPLYSDPLYALGVIRETYRGQVIIGHDGVFGGFKSMFRFMPQLDWGIVMMGNSDDSFVVQQILAHVLFDDLLKVPAADRVDWESFWPQWDANDLARDENKSDLEVPEIPEPLGLPLESLVGTYRDAGYKDIVVELRDGKLVADCSERCFAFNLTFEHLTGNTFCVSQHYILDDYTSKVKGEIRVRDGKVGALGVEFEEEMVIWFERVV